MTSKALGSAVEIQRLIISTQARVLGENNREFLGLVPAGITLQCNTGIPSWSSKKRVVGAKLTTTLKQKFQLLDYQAGFGLTIDEAWNSLVG